MKKTLSGAMSIIGACAGQIREYNLTVQANWVSFDGNPRMALTVNNQVPGPVIQADEGDTLRIQVKNNLLVKSAMHWHGVYQIDHFWNDGTPGATQWPLEPKSTYTYEMTVGNQTGIYFYHGHFGPVFGDGQRGPIWIRPLPERPRPYRLISDKQEDIDAMLDAEHQARHAMVADWNYEGMEVLMIQFRDAGNTPSCAASILFNGKGRISCILRKELDKYNPARKRGTLGCLPPLIGGVFQHSEFTNERECQETHTDMEVFQAMEGERYIFINFVHSGAHHEMRLSIDEHDMYIVAADGDFTIPVKAQAINLNMAERISVIVRLDQDPGDYTIRAVSIVPEQIVEGVSILRYPGAKEAKEDGIMKIPDSKPHMNLVGDMIGGGRKMDETADLPPFPPRSPPVESDHPFRFAVNQTDNSSWVLASEPHQGFRQQMPPMLWNEESRGSNAFSGLKNGSTVDIILANFATGDHPFHKHNHKFWIIGQGQDFFRWKDVATALRESPESFNMIDPPFRDGARVCKEHGAWTVLRYTISFPAMSMFHCHKIAHFAGGQQVVFLEGAEAMPPLPDEIKNLTHAEFVPPLRYGPLE